jgi:hypothetical protein
MLTSLSHRLRRLVDAALGRAEPGAPVPADVSPVMSKVSLRIVRDGEAPPADRDIAIRVSAGSSVGASAFVAGQGARIYSLDAFRTARPSRRPGAAA